MQLFGVILFVIFFYGVTNQEIRPVKQDLPFLNSCWSLVVLYVLCDGPQECALKSEAGKGGLQ